MRKYGDTSPHLERHATPEVKSSYRFPSAKIVEVEEPEKVQEPSYPVGYLPDDYPVSASTNTATAMLLREATPNVRSGTTRSAYPVEAAEFGDRPRDRDRKYRHPRERLSGHDYDGYGYTLPAPPDPGLYGGY